MLSTAVKTPTRKVDCVTFLMKTPWNIDKEDCGNGQEISSLCFC
jgi:hypothetical protein